MKILKTALYIFLFSLTGCFPEDEALPLVPFEGVIGTVENSLYTHQTFFSLMDSCEISSNKYTDWDLGFEASATGEHIILNSADNLYVTNLGVVDFKQTTSIPDNAVWSYDASSGNTDSLAINQWVNTLSSPYTYSQNVYILGKSNGISYTPIKKIKFIELTDTYYKMVSDVMDNSVPDTFLIEKNNEINYSKITLQNTIETIAIEPENKSWDIQFTQYASIIPDDDGTPTPYMIRGAFINTTKIKVAQYYISNNDVPEIKSNRDLEEDNLKYFFETYTFSSVNDSDYLQNQDAIGWEWKDVSIDEAANTAVYKANTRKVYLIKDIETNKTYKLRFISYYTNGVKGYPWFQYIEM